MRSVLTTIDDDVDHSLDDKNTTMFFTKNKSLEREMKKPTNFSLLLLLRLSFYVVVDRQPTTKEDRRTDRFFLLSLSLSLFLPFTDERTKRRSQEDKREAAFSHEAVASYSQSSFELRAFEFYSAPCCPLFSLSKIAAFPFVVVECDDEKKRSIHARVVKK